MTTLPTICLIILVNVILYGRTIWYGIVVDDIKTRQRGLRGEKFFKAPLTFLRYRLYGSMACESIKGDHIITLLIHITVSVLIYIIFGNFWAAMLFSVHPVNNQVSCWMNGKRFGIAAICVLMFYWLGFFGIGFWLVIPLFQISGLFAPILLCFKGYWYAPLILPIFFVIFRNYIFKKYKSRQMETTKEMQMIKPVKLVLFFKTFGFYIRHCILPQNIFMWHPFLYRYGTTKKWIAKSYVMDKHFWFGLVAFTAVSLLMFFNRSNEVGFGLFWFLLFIVQWCNITTITQTIADRYCYLPLIGLMLALGSILSHFSIVPFIYYTTLMHLLMPMYKSWRMFLEHHTHHGKHDPSAFYYLAQNYIANGNPIRALTTAQEGLIYNSGDFKLLILLGSSFILVDKNNKKAAASAFELAKKNMIPSKEEGQLKLIKTLQEKAGVA